MFNNFHGFHLVEELHKRNLERAAKRLNSKFFKLLLAIAATLTIWLLPADSFGIANLTDSFIPIYQSAIQVYFIHLNSHGTIKHLA